MTATSPARLVVLVSGTGTNLQALLDGDRPSSAAARDRLQPLASLATALAPSQVAPSAEFAAGLRERLVTEAAARVPAPALPTQRRRRPHQVRRGVAAVAALALLGGAGAAVASTRAVRPDRRMTLAMAATSK